MRTVFVILIGLCVWLLAERQKLSEGVGGLESRLSTMEKEKEQLQRKLAVQPEAAAAPVKKNWLQDRIEKSANGLDGATRGPLIR
jgi:hypothetical protein